MNFEKLDSISVVNTAALWHCSIHDDTRALWLLQFKAINNLKKHIKALKFLIFDFYGRDPEMISITAAPEAPPPRIRILDARQREVETVRIGDRLTFRIEIPEDSKHTNIIDYLHR